MLWFVLKVRDSSRWCYLPWLTCVLVHSQLACHSRLVILNGSDHAVMEGMAHVWHWIWVWRCYIRLGQSNHDHFDQGRVQKWPWSWYVLGCQRILVGYCEQSIYSHGLEVDSQHAFAESLFKVVNRGTGAEQYRHNAVEVAMYNLMDFMWELEVSSCPFVPMKLFVIG